MEEQNYISHFLKFMLVMAAFLVTAEPAISSPSEFSNQRDASLAVVVMEKKPLKLRIVSIADKSGRVRALTKLDGKVLVVDYVDGQQSLRQTGNLIELTQHIHERNIITTWKKNKRSLNLIRVVTERPRVFFKEDNDDLDDLGSSKQDIAHTIKCTDRNGQLEQIPELTIGATAFDKSNIINSSCAKHQSELSMALAQVRYGDRTAKTFLNCMESKGLVDQAYRIESLLTESSAGPSALKISCAENSKRSLSSRDDALVTLGSDAIADGVSTAKTTDIVFHELLHISGYDMDSSSPIDDVVACCGSNQSSKACAKNLVPPLAKEDVVNIESHFVIAETIKTNNEQSSQAANEVASVVPQTISVQVGAADNLDNAKPAIAKLHSTSGVLGRQATNVMNKLDAGFVSTANAKSNDDSGSQAVNYGSTEVYKVDAQGTTLKLPSGQLARVSIPFSEQGGFGEAKVETFNAPSGADITRVASAGAARGSGESGNAGKRTSQGAGQTAASEAQSSGSGSGEASSGGGSGGSAFIADAGGSQAKAGTNRSVASSPSNNQEAAKSVVKEVPVADWKEARALLVNSTKPEAVLSAPWFQGHLQKFETQVYYKGKPYGAAAKRRWNLDPYWKKPTQ